MINSWETQVTPGGGAVFIGATLYVFCTQRVYENEMGVEAY